MSIVSEKVAEYRASATPIQPIPPAATPPDTDGARHVRLFRNGANQAVRIPKEFELPGNNALMRREGDRIVIEPIKPVFKKGSPTAILAMLDELAKLGAIDEAFPDVDEGLLPLDDIDLGAD